MKIRFGLRALVIITYLGLFSAGLLLIYEYQELQRIELSGEISDLQLQKFMAEVVSDQPHQAEAARNLLNQLNEIKATIEIGNRQTAVYSAFYLIIVLVISLALFFWAIYTLTSPLAKFSQAAKEIAEGNFDIKLKEKGTWEIREAQHSFNLMSAQLRNTQEKLLEAEKFSIWKQFSRMLAHEIKNPLTPIRLSLERLIEKKESPDFYRIFDRSISIISQEVENLQNLAVNFSNFAKDTPVNQRQFRIYEQIKNIIRSYEDRIKIILSGDDFVVEFDELHFYQIITNILQNAIDATDNDEPLEISLDKYNRTLMIADQGAGIDEQDLKKIFEPYFTKKKKGIGLGLALVKKLSNINHAQIEVQSKPGSGTVFTIKFATFTEQQGGNNESNDH
jgi:two-component system, NtrC family, nitrogen regulation sensor histidine kinase NtrY